MEDVAGAPVEKKDGNPLLPITNPDADGGTASFTDIRLLRPGTYKYKISEEGLYAPGFTPLDMGEKFVTITVKDPDHRQLTSNLTYNADHPLIFRNAYMASSYKTEFKVQKILSAAPGLRTPDISNSFSFTLKRKTPSCPMPAAAGTGDSLTLQNPDADGGGSGGTGSSAGVTYEPSGEALTDSQFAAMWQEASKYLGRAHVWGGSFYRF